MEYQHIAVEALSPALGAEISGVALDQELDGAVAAEIRAAFLAHHVIFFRDQTLTP